MNLSVGVVFSACCLALAWSKPTGAVSKRVIGGYPVSRGESPFLVTLQLIDFENRTAEHICGASLIAGRFLLTAAHCVEDILDEPERLKAIIGTLRSGSTNTHENHTHYEDTEEFRNVASSVIEGLLQGRKLKDILSEDEAEEDSEESDSRASEEEEEEEDDSGVESEEEKRDLNSDDDENDEEAAKNLERQILAALVDGTELEYEACIQKIVMHELYDKETIENDVAVLVMAMDVPRKFQDHVTPIWLPTKDMEEVDYPEPGTECTFFGWGMAHIPQESDKGYKEDSEPFAQKVDLTVRNDSFCKIVRDFGTEAAEYRKETMFCAGNIGTEEHKGVYRGDSGGPLICGFGDRYYQAGIASFTSSFGAYLPGFFVRVTTYEDWIKNVMWQNS